MAEDLVAHEVFKQKEAPEDRFKRLATKRTRRALRAMYLVGALARPRARHYTDEQVTRILTALRRAVDDVESQFRGRKRSEAEFTL